MASLPQFDMSGKKVGDFEIDADQISATINKQLLHDCVVMYQANLRQGSQKTKSRAEVAGTTKKMYRQKGTGNARAGSRRSGVRVGGGHIFAINNRDYYYRLPKKAIRLATKMAVASKIKSDQVVVVDGLKCDEIKTKVVDGLLNGVGKVKSTLIVTAEHSANVYKSARNIPGVSVLPVADLNALAVLKPQKVVFCKSALEAFRDKAAAEAAAKKEAATS